MYRLLKSLAFLATVLFASPALSEDRVEYNWLFVQTADHATLSDDGALIIPVQREIFAFTDRPERLHNFLPPETLVGYWDEDFPDGFHDDPPNAVLTWLADGQVVESEVLLIDAQLTEDRSAIVYSAEVEAGSPLSPSMEWVSLFIDHLDDMGGPCTGSPQPFGCDCEKFDPACRP